LATSLPFHYLWAEKGRNVRSSDQQKTGIQKENLPTENQPRITIVAPIYDVGEVWEGDEVPHTFTAKNTGTAQLIIEKVTPG